VTKKNKIKDKDPWIPARRKYRLNAEQVEMAKKLGTNPKKFGKLAPNKAEPWKESLGDFIERCREKRFNKTWNDFV